MGRTYSLDLRERVHGAVTKGMSRRAAARHFGVSASTGVRIAKRMAQAGTLEPVRQGRPSGSVKLASCRNELIAKVNREKDVTLMELRAWLCAEHKVVVHHTTLSRFLRSEGYTYKKNGSGERSWTR